MELLGDVLVGFQKPVNLSLQLSELFFLDEHRMW